VFVIAQFTSALIKSALDPRVNRESRFARVRISLILAQGEAVVPLDRRRARACIIASGTRSHRGACKHAREHARVRTWRGAMCRGSQDSARDRVRVCIRSALSRPARPLLIGALSLSPPLPRAIDPPALLASSIIPSPNAAEGRGGARSIDLVGTETPNSKRTSAVPGALCRT